MHKLVVLYPEPADKDAFQAYYESTHLPLARELPGAITMNYSLGIAALEEEAPYFAIFEAVFDSPQSMGAALGSPQGQAVAADVPNYATGGAHIMHYPITSAGSVDPKAIVEEYLARWNGHDAEGIVAMLADGGQYVDPSLSEPVSGEHLVQYLKGMFTVAPNLHLEVLGAAADGPTTGIAFWRMTGDVAVPGGRSSGSYDLHGSDIIHVDAAGRITWTAALYDQVAFLTQSGLPLPESSTEG